MPIIDYTTEEHKIPKDAQNVREVTEQYRGSFQNPTRIWAWDTHVGLCLQEREQNGSSDSDFEMLVWESEVEAAIWKRFASTRWWSGPSMGSSVDATEETKSAWKAWADANQVAAEKLNETRKNNQPRRGMELRVITAVTRGKNQVAAGEVGRCFWSDTSFRYDSQLGVLFMGYQGRVGLDMMDGRRVFLDVGRVEALQIQEVAV